MTNALSDEEILILLELRILEPAGKLVVYNPPLPSKDRHEWVVDNLEPDGRDWLGDS